MKENRLKQEIPATSLPSPMSDPGQPVRERVSALILALLETSNINPGFRPIIAKFSSQFLSSVDDAGLVDGIKKVRDEIIPFLIDDHENPPGK